MAETEPHWADTELPATEILAEAGGSPPEEGWVESVLHGGETSVESADPFLTSDEGAVIARGRRETREWRLVQRAARESAHILVPTGVLVQVWRNDPEQHAVSHLTKDRTTLVDPLDEWQWVTDRRGTANGRGTRLVRLRLGRCRRIARHPIRRWCRATGRSGAVTGLFGGGDVDGSEFAADGGQVVLARDVCR